ncbi:MAG: helix-turn-helix transcriptional regulator [Bradyrhizobium sp.]
MSVGESEQLLDLIYEAAAIPEKWPTVLDSLARIAGAVGSFLITTDTRDFRWTSSDSVRQLGHDFIAGGYLERSFRMKVLMQQRGGFAREIDRLTAAEMDADVALTELLRPRGFGWVVGTMIRAPMNDMLAFSIERRLVDGPVEDKAVVELDALRPHLARAALMSARLRLERAQGMTESLTTMGLPSAVLLGSGKVVAISPLFEKIGPQVIFKAFGGVALADAGANALLSQAIENLSSVESEVSAKSIAVPADGENEAFVVHLIPVRRSAHDVFGSAMGILVVTPLGSVETLPEDLLNGLFDLSPAEVRAANGIIQGKTIEELAVAFGLSRETIRSQMKAVFAKTGTARQADLVSLLANVRVPKWHQAR